MFKNLFVSCFALFSPVMLGRKSTHCGTRLTRGLQKRVKDPLTAAAK